MNKPVRFEDAMRKAKLWAHNNVEVVGKDAIILRDLFGRIRFIIKGSGADKPKPHHEQAAKLNEELGLYSPGVNSLFIYGDDLVAAETVFDSEDAHPIDPEKPEEFRLLDRQVTGNDWLRPAFPSGAAKTKRATFYGIKGGVGRSTAMTILALEIARQGKKVLALDMDLESPGISSILLPIDNLPQFGIVDWFVEDAVGQADAELLRSMVSLSPLGRDSAGEVRVVPAFGATEQAYIEKLSRVYLDVRKESIIETFAARLNRLLTDLEEANKPDIVLIDSRAGLHDLAAIAITRLDATVFLFATQGRQTWASYRLLFNYWQQNPLVTKAFRDNLKIVDSMVPETGIEEHIRNSRLASYNLFQETIYEETPGGAVDTFNFQLDDEDSPHYPLPIRWNRSFQEFDPLSRYEVITQAQIEAAYGEFLKGAKQILSIDET
jgi:cellulose biosynthesis protein BcsQ